MESAQHALTQAKKIRVNHFLPYLAVFQADLHQTFRSWLYRLWVLLSVLVSVGYVLYRFGAYQQAGMVQPASEVMTDLMRWVVLGGVTLIIILTAGCISAERGNVADAVLSRGISRNSYFLGKWHARLFSILGTFMLLSGLLLMACVFLLHDDRLSLQGCIVGIVAVCAMLAVVVTCGVTISALVNSTLMAIAIVWMTLYGAGFAMTFLPASYPSPQQTLQNLPNILQGMYSLQSLYHLVAWSAGVSTALAVVGMICYSRRDI